MQKSFFKNQHLEEGSFIFNGKNVSISYNHILLIFSQLK